MHEQTDRPTKHDMTMQWSTLEPSQSPIQCRRKAKQRAWSEQERYTSALQHWPKTTTQVPESLSHSWSTLNCFAKDATITSSGV